MGEDRSSFWPNRTSWVQSIPPPDKKTVKKRFVVFSPFIHACAGAVASLLYLYLCRLLFDEKVMIFAGGLIVMAYISFLVILKKPDTRYGYRVLIFCSGILLGMMIMKQYIS